MEEEKNIKDYIDLYLSEVVDITLKIDKKEIEKAVNILLRLKKRNGRLFFLGVGGGAGNASHAVNDFRKIAGIESYTPTDNVSELTARVNDDGWDTHCPRQLSRLGFIQIANRVHGCGRIAPQGAVAEQDLGLIACANCQSVENFRLIIQQDHPSPCHNIPFAEIRHLRITLDERINHIRNVNRFALDLELLNDQLSMFQRFRR